MLRTEVRAARARAGDDRERRDLRREDDRRAVPRRAPRRPRGERLDRAAPLGRRVHRALAAASTRILRLAKRADELGYALVLVDGDASSAAPRPSGPSTTRPRSPPRWRSPRARAPIASIHFAHFWNPVLLARSLATLQELAGGRLVSLFGVGAPRRNARARSARAERRRSGSRGSTRHSDVVRALLAGETVTHRGRFATLDGVRDHAAGAAGPLAVSAAGPRALERACAATRTSGTRTFRRCARGSSRCARSSVARCRRGSGCSRGPARAATLRSPLPTPRALVRATSPTRSSPTPCCGASRRAAASASRAARRARCGAADRRSAGLDEPKRSARSPRSPERQTAGIS